MKRIHVVCLVLALTLTVGSVSLVSCGKTPEEAGYAEGFAAGKEAAAAECEEQINKLIDTIISLEEYMVVQKYDAVKATISNIETISDYNTAVVVLDEYAKAIRELVEEVNIQLNIHVGAIGEPVSGAEIYLEQDDEELEEAFNELIDLVWKVNDYVKTVDILIDTYEGATTTKEQVARLIREAKNNESVIDALYIEFSILRMTGVHKGGFAVSGRTST